MKHADFAIGTIFYTNTGQCWRCTDIGTRTILAIEIKPELDSSWFNGPPYAVIEVPFDEHDIDSAYRDEKEAIDEALHRIDKSAHPGFPHTAVITMCKATLTSDSQSYPRRQILRFDRVNTTGKILHPYAAERRGEEWYILTYEVFTSKFEAVTESEFIRLHHATEQDLQKCREQNP